MAFWPPSFATVQSVQSTVSPTLINPTLYNAAPTSFYNHPATFIPLNSAEVQAASYAGAARTVRQVPHPYASIHGPHKAPSTMIPISHFAAERPVARSSGRRIPANLPQWEV
eukprot:TRINITY_DN76664_c0_g1_i1.p1 TRINITY_DN76664_c0_g1~~TRINITY_DN76664_c0_g1_i1.p1  ORF type:complete len:112 (+),score=5.16 TRINITY_DN76664_c0_g1_i1:318-653(+)